VNDSHELIKVVGYQFKCDYGYSAPTGLFNLQLPHLPRRIQVSQTQTYRQFLVKQKLQANAHEADHNSDDEEPDFQDA
jgi:hypothetical protein